MSFEDVMGNLMRWQTGVEALSALGAELTLKQAGTAAPPEILAALHGVSEAADLGDLDELPPQQQAMIVGLVRLALHQALDLLDEPGRAPGWSYRDPVILDGWGRASMMVPAMIAGAHPDLADVESFLDVGTGVGLLAVAATNVWPRASVVGIDVWEPSLERARGNVAHAGLDDRITLRTQDTADIDDTDTYDCIWVPAFFISEDALTKGLTRLFRAARPGGWIVLARFAPPPDPLMDATGNLRTIRGGGANLDTKRGVELLEQAGFTSVQVAPRTMPAPMELILGQKAR